MNSLFRLTPRISSQQVRLYSSEAAVPRVSATRGG